MVRDQIYNTVQLDPLFCEIFTLRIDDEKVIMTLRSDDDEYISFKVVRGTDEDTVATVGKTAQLAEFILRDPLLHRGVKSMHVVVKNAIVEKANVRFYSHDIDMTSFFTSRFDTRRALTRILQECQKSSPDTICCISYEPVPPGARVVRIKGEKWLYGEQVLKKWITMRGTSPFTRKEITLADVEYVKRVRKAVPLEDQPQLQPLRKRVRTSSTMHISAVVDTSGSMSSCKDANASFIDFIRHKKEESKEDTSVTIWTFNTDVHKMLHVPDIRNLTLPLTDEQMRMLEPQGATALHDAIYAAGEDLLQRMESGDKGILCVVTDGQDTASSAHTRVDVHGMLERLKSSHVTPIFLAANIGDARDVGQQLGFDRDTSLTFTPSTVGAAYASLRQATQRGTRIEFTDIERQMSAPN